MAKFSLPKKFRGDSEIEQEAFNTMASPLNAQVQSGDPRKELGAAIRPFEVSMPEDKLGYLPKK